MFHKHTYDGPQDVYLGSEWNPDTGKAYDFWLVNGESATCQHGDDPSEYGSMRISDLYQLSDTLDSLRAHAFKDGKAIDYCWAVWRVHQLAYEHLRRMDTLARQITHNLKDFALHVLGQMNEGDAWQGTALLEDFARKAKELDLAEDDSQGYFVARYTTGYRMETNAQTSIPES